MKTPIDFKNTDKAYISEFNGHYKFLISFGGISHGLGIPIFEFFNTVGNLNCDKLFIRDINQSWYQKGIDEKIKDVFDLAEFLKFQINKKKYRKVCALGNSMGGYAAILFGVLIGVDSVISFAPQTFIDKSNRKKYKDYRWFDQINSIHISSKIIKDEFLDLKKLLKQQKNIPPIDLYYSPEDILDKIHACRLEKIKQVNLIEIENGGHSLVKSLRDNNKLLTIIESKFN